MRILLISPPPLNTLEEPEVANIKTGTAGCFPPLGLMYLAGYARKNSSHDVIMVDANAFNMSYKQLEKEIRKIKPDLVGLGTTSFSLKDTIITAKIVKGIDKKIHVNVGGPHLLIYPKETLSLKPFDSVTIGDGEVTFLDLADALAQGKDLRTVKGLGFKEGKDMIINEPREPIENLDMLPFPARDLLPIKVYYSGVSDKKFMTTMLSSRGCPWNCRFCFSKGIKYRQRSPKNIVDEISECAKMGITEFNFVDETFNANPKNVIEVCDLIMKRGLKIDWAIRGRINTINEKVLKKLKQAGCTRINYGVESGNDEILKVINKCVTKDLVKRVFEMTNKEGIKTVAFFMIGHPTEKREQVLETIRFAKEIKPDYAVFSIFLPYPKTEFYEMGLKTGLIKEDYWKKFARNPEKPFKPKVWEEIFTEKELYDLSKIAYRDFYFDPRYLLRRVFGIRSFTEFSRHAKTALKMMHG
ncbi:MAG: radical SAM protein [Candidatus Woesearchaeota archaeon]|nr:radical SAM protein [Candidatus Woesearchaeota archaeon]